MMTKERGMTERIMSWVLVGWLSDLLRYGAVNSLSLG
jgi:hypothetical protein